MAMNKFVYYHEQNVNNALTKLFTTLQGGPGLQVKNSRAYSGHLGKYFGVAHYGSETYPKGAGRV